MTYIHNGIIALKFKYSEWIHSKVIQFLQNDYNILMNATSSISIALSWNFEIMIRDVSYQKTELKRKAQIALTCSYCFLQKDLKNGIWSITCSLWYILIDFSLLYFYFHFSILLLVWWCFKNHMVYETIEINIMLLLKYIMIYVKYAFYFPHILCSYFYIC